MREPTDAGSRIFYEAMNAVVGIFLVGLFALFDDQVDQREFAGLNGLVGALDCGWDLRVLGDADSAATEGIGHGGEVWVLQLSAGDPTRVIAFLVGTDGAVFLVVHDNDQRGGPVLGGGGQFLTVHQKFAVTGNRDHDLVWVLQRGGNRRWDGVPHGTVAGGDQRTIVVGWEVAVHPVGVLSGAEGDHGIVWQRWYQVGHHG